MSNLLIDEHPLQVLPGLATKIGLNEAIILQQIHYWNKINEKSNNNYRDGYYWTFNSVKQWMEQFPFWSKNTIQRTITNLENMKLVVTGNYNKLKIDRTKWYRIDYDVLQALTESPFTQIGVKDIPKWVNHLTEMGLPLPEDNSEISKEINKKDRGQNSVTDRVDFSVYELLLNDLDYTTFEQQQLEVLSDFVEMYKEYRKEEHPELTREQWDKARQAMLYIDNTLSNCEELDIDDELQMMESYFKTEFQEGCNYSVMHYISGDLRSVRYFDVLY